MWRWLAVILCVLGACQEDGETIPSSGPRIASLSPAMTKSLIAAGLRTAIVGRSAFCEGLDQVPIVGDLQNLDLEQLVRVQPTHILMQRHPGSIPSDWASLFRHRGWTTLAQPISGNDDVLAVLQWVELTFGSSAARCSALAASIQQARAPRPVAHAPSALIVSPGATPLAWGSHTFLGEFVEAAGVRNQISGPGWHAMSLEDIARIDPDLLLVPCDKPDDPIEPLDSLVDPARIHRIVADGIEIPGPHLAHLTDQLHRALSAYTDAP